MTTLPTPSPSGGLTAAECYQRAKRTAHEALEELELSSPVTLESIREDLERVRNRKIVVSPMDGIDDSKVCGLWFALDRTDMVFHSRAVSGLHRQQIILHEYSHMILQHEMLEMRAGATAGLFPDLQEDTVVRALKRSVFHDEVEMSAEILADLMASAIRDGASQAAKQPLNFRKIFA